MPNKIRNIQLSNQKKWTLKRRLQRPWELHYYHARQRCIDKNRNAYQWYGGRGIKCLFSKEEVKFLWFRDKAYDMERPSIERKNVNGDYCLENCEFIELRENISRGHSIRLLLPTPLV